MPAIGEALLGLMQPNTRPTAPTLPVQQTQQTPQPSGIGNLGDFIQSPLGIALLLGAGRGVLDSGGQGAAQTLSNAVGGGLAGAGSVVQTRRAREAQEAEAARADRRVDLEERRVDLEGERLDVTREQVDVTRQQAITARARQEELERQGEFERTTKFDAAQKMQQAQMNNAIRVANIQANARLTTAQASIISGINESYTNMLLASEDPSKVIPYEQFVADQMRLFGGLLPPTTVAAAQQMASDAERQYRQWLPGAKLDNPGLTDPEYRQIFNEQKSQVLQERAALEGGSPDVAGAPRGAQRVTPSATTEPNQVGDGASAVAAIKTLASPVGNDLSRTESVMRARQLERKFPGSVKRAIEELDATTVDSDDLRRWLAAAFGVPVDLANEALRQIDPSLASSDPTLGSKDIKRGLDAWAEMTRRLLSKVRGN